MNQPAIYDSTTPPLRTISLLKGALDSTKEDLARIHPKPTTMQVTSHTQVVQETLQKTLRVVGRQINDQHQINLLPTKLFQYMLGFLKTWDIISASHVCSKWRHSILDCAALWSDVEFDCGVHNATHGVSMIEAIMRRSKCAQLKLAIGRTAAPAFLAILQSNVYRIVELKLGLPSQEDTLLNHDAPALQAVELELSYAVPPWLEPTRFHGPLFNGSAPNLVFVAMHEISFSAFADFSLPSVRCAQIYLDGQIYRRSADELSLTPVARAFPNLNQFCIGQPAIPLFASLADLKSIPAIFSRLTICDPGFGYRETKLDFGLIPYIKLECAIHGNSSTSTLLGRHFAAASMVRIYGAARFIEGRMRDGRVFLWTNISQSRGACATCRHCVETGAELLGHIMLPSVTASLVMLDHSIRGATVDGRTFTWTQFPPPFLEVFKPWFNSITSLHVAVDVLFRLLAVLPELKSLTVEIGEKSSPTILRTIMGLGRAQHQFSQPTPALKHLTVTFKTHLQNPYEEVHAQRFIRLQELDHLFEYLCVPRSDLVSVRLTGLHILAPPCLAFQEAVASITHSAIDFAHDPAPDSPSALPPLVTPLCLDDDPSHHYMDVTPLLRECRAEHRFDDEPRWSSVQFDADSSDGESFVPDFDEDDYTSSSSSDEEEGRDTASEDEDSGSAGEDDGSSESNDATDGYDAELADLALERDEWLKVQGEDPTPPALPGRRFVEVMRGDAAT